MEESKSSMHILGKKKIDEMEASECSSEEESELEKELADVSFEELQEARSNGFHLSRLRPSQEKKTGRVNKNRPTEVSSKKHVGRFREVIQAPKRVVRDPRFESLCGTLDNDGFRKRYSFLFEAQLPTEREKLKKKIKKTNDPKGITELKSHISWIDKQLKSGPTMNTDAKILAEHKKKEQEAAKLGKRPYYLKKSELRERKLIEKYNDLKEAGKLEAYIERRRRKNASKDHRYVPYRRPSTSEVQ
ncbi:uncharacterized protein [Aristolochia californica]|uniref:uncharacterized protein n=1 Tax=Aristolochia californica TaxID=171875 RepID=UPI0035DAE303